MTRAVKLDDLPADVRARVTRRSGDVETSKPAPSNANRQRGRSRSHTGSTFEAELNLLHRQYEFSKWGKIWPNYPPFVKTKRGWQPKGAGVVDRTGHVCVRGQFNRSGDPLVDWRGCSPFDVKDSRMIPVAFDAKVLGERSGATYHHAREQQHQLHQLREASQAGVYAFMLVHAPKVKRVFALGIENHFHDLISLRGVSLWEMTVQHPACDPQPFPLVPSIVHTPPLGWDWIPLLQWLAPG